VKRFKKAKDIKVAAIGYGGAYGMGRAHLLQMQQAGMTPTAAVDPDTERLKAAEAEFPGIETYASVDEMIAKTDVNLAAVITPHNTHAPIALQCLKAGIHVVCEKPFAVSTAECDKMIAAAKKKKLLVSAYHNRHWDGGVLHALKMIRKKGVIGDIVRIEAHMGAYGRPRDWWRSSRTISGGIAFDWGVHLLEYALQLIDSEMTEVSGYAHTGHWAPKVKWEDDTNEDEAFAVVRFQSGQWLTLNMTQIDSLPKQEDRNALEITGTKGTYLCSNGSGRHTIITHKRGDVVTTVGQDPACEWDRYYKNVCDHLVKGDELVITPEWARRPIHILDLAARSAEAGKAMKAKYG
jgi:predicted dehydrogenase